MLRYVACAIAIAVTNTVFAQGSPRQQPPSQTARAPVGGLVAAAKSPVPDAESPDKPDLQGTLLLIRDSRRRLLAKRLFTGRFICKMLWSPDGRFLALCSESAGGHSPWHMNSYFWSRSDHHFRSIDYRAGLVVSDRFSFAPAHTLTVQVAQWRHGMWDSEHPLDKHVNLEKIRRSTPPLLGDENTYLKAATSRANGPAANDLPNR
jgi:hypothetical protein